MYLFSPGEGDAYFFTIGNIGPFFILILVNIIFVVASFMIPKLDDHAQKFLVGAITGTVGSFWCGSYIKFGSSYDKYSPAYVVILIMLFLVPHVIHIYEALNNNQKFSTQEKQEEERRQEQEGKMLNGDVHRKEATRSNGK